MSGQKLVMRSVIEKRRDVLIAILLVLCAGLSTLSLSGCAGTYYVEANHTPESRYNTYYAPDYYPYYPWYSYYGGAYYSDEY